MARWYGRRTAEARGARKTMIVALASKLLVALIVALASKLLVALWRLATTGEVPEGVVRGQRRE